MDNAPTVPTPRMETSLPAMPDRSPAAMMLQAMQGNMDLEKLEKFLDLQDRWEKNEARKAYTGAMAAFKQNPPEIEKDRKVDYTTKAGNRVKYDHASLGNVANKINAALGKHGLSASWTTVQEDARITVTCRITHIMGHSESTSLSAAPDDSGGKNAIQAVGSTIAYLERYTVLALTGLATSDMDDDGKASSEPIKYITEKQISTLRDLMNERGIKESRLLKYMEVEKIEEIVPSQYGKAEASVKATPPKGAGV